MTEPKHDNENNKTEISQNITLAAFKENIAGIHSLKELRDYRREFYERGTKIIESTEPIFTEGNKGSPSVAIDPNFSGINTEDLFVDSDGSIVEKVFDKLENDLMTLEDLENEKKLNEQKQIDSTKVEEEINEDNVALEKIIDETIYPSVEDLAQDSIAKQQAQKVESTVSTESMSGPVINLESTTDEPEKPIIKELAEKNIRNAKTIKELSLILVNSDGIDSNSQGHFSGADLAFLIERVSKGEAYIEEITRENGLRETVWNLIKNENGTEPKSLEHEETQAVREKLNDAISEHQDTSEKNIPPTELPSHPPAPKDTQRHVIPLTPVPEKKAAWTGIKKFFGFGMK